MGEIKSTLDLVMEKTKHLKLTKEEREQQKLNELKKKLKVLLQKYKEAGLNLNQVKNELNMLQQSYDLTAKNSLLSEIIDDINLNQDNRPLLVLLKELFGLNLTKIESIINDYQQTIRSTAQKRINKIKKDLAKKRSISGSAVVPNLESDNKWISELQDINRRFEQSLNQEKKMLI